MSTLTRLSHRNQPDEILLAFARAVRAAGVAVTPDRAQTFLAAVAVAGADDPGGTYRCGRATLCSSPDDLDRYDKVFDAWFSQREPLPRTVARPTPAVRGMPLTEPDEVTATGGDDVLRVAASDLEVLRHKDIADLTAAEKALLTRMLEAIRPRLPRRPAHRRTPWHRGEVDRARTLRTSLRHLGEPSRVPWRRRASRTRRLVLLIDISGSMSDYADVLLRLAHRYTQAGRDVETFTLGTRLTRITAALRLRSPERALAAASQTVADFSGGTRLGQTLQWFLDRWGRRGTARGAVVVVFSDGWERGDTTLLAEQMARLRRLAHRVIWANPHRGRAGYRPVQAGVVAALPHVDDFVAGHSLAAYLELGRLIAPD